MDFEYSIDVLYHGFLSWYKRQSNGIVFANRPPPPDASPFQLLHKGSRCAESRVIGKGKYSTVYEHNGMAYKMIRNTKDLSSLRCNIKELVFFHSFPDATHLAQATRSQIVMEHGTIRRIIHEMPLAQCTINECKITSMDQFVTLFRGVAKGLQALHSRNIIHGDMKPSNILVFSENTTKITDFTLTSFETKGSEVPLGTLYWRAPECLETQNCFMASDIWALGVVMLDVLVGCNYMMDVLCVENDQDLVCKLPHFIASIQTEDWWTRSIRLAVPFPTQPIQSLFTKLLVWDPSKRWTIDEILQHELFEKVQTSERVEKPEKLEKTVLPYNQIRVDYMEHFQTRISEKDEWLLQDITNLATKLMEKLEQLQCTYDPKHVVSVCSEFLFFLWKDVNILEKNPLFASRMYHILRLLDYQVFF